VFDPDPPKVNTEGIEVEHPPFMSQSKVRISLGLWCLTPLSTMFQLYHVQSVFITTKVVNPNPVHVEVYLIQHYLIKFVSDLQQVGGFLQVLRFPPPIKLTATI
jgi:hypothetical protein